MCRHINKKEEPMKKSRSVSHPLSVADFARLAIISLDRLATHIIANDEAMLVASNGITEV